MLYGLYPMENKSPAEFDFTTTTSSNNIISSDSNSNVIVKLKRLKIEEGIITKSMHSFCSGADQNDSGVDDLNDQDPLEQRSDSNNLSKYLAQTKHSLEQIKILFEDIRSYVATADDNIEDLDVDDVKKEILELETKISTFKERTRVEFQALKEEEDNLKRQLNEINVNKTKELKKTPVKSKLLINEVVSSPVRSMINSPFKCREVQNFQEFMKSSKKMYDGWSPYCHNIFVQTWKKYFHSNYNIKEAEKPRCQGLVFFNSFKTEVLQKVPGLTEQDIISHGNWYLEYLSVKTDLQNAVMQWKNNKKLLKAVDHSTDGSKKVIQRKHCSSAITLSRNSAYGKNSNFEERRVLTTTRNSESFTLAVDLKSGYTKPTLQWNSKCISLDEQAMSTIRVEDIGKLGIPYWRQNLHAQ